MGEPKRHQFPSPSKAGVRKTERLDTAPVQLTFWD